MGIQYKGWYIALFVSLVLILTMVRSGETEQLRDEGTDLFFLPQTDADLQELWIKRQEAISKEGAVAGEKKLEEINERKLDKGIINLWTYALLFMREGVKLEDKDRAMKLGEIAQEIAPDLPAVYFYTSHIILEKERWRAYSAFEKYVEGFKAYTRNLPLACGQVLNVFSLFALGLFLAILAFCLLVFFKRLPIYYYALTEEIKGEWKDMIQGVGRIVIFFIPLILQLNIMWCVLFWCLILWRYLSGGEKWIVILSFLLITYIPPIGVTLFRFIEGPQAQVVFDIYETTYGERDPQALERLRLWTQDKTQDRDALITLALAFKREGDYAEAKRYYQKSIDLNPADTDVLSNLGNLYVALNEPENAIALYQRAIKENPHNGVYYFNLSKALSQKSMLALEDADKNFRKAKELSPQVIGAHLEIDSPHPNRSVIDHIISLGRLRERLYAVLWQETGPSFLVLDVWLSSLSPRIPYVFPLLFLALIIVLPYIGKVGGSGWWRCSLCGVISTQTHEKREGRKKVCVRCFRILKGKEIDHELKEKKLREIMDFQRRMKLYDKLFPFVLPGGGHVWKGYNLRGFLFLWIFFMFVAKCCYWKGVVPPSIPVFISGMYGGGFLFALAFVLFYLLVLKGAYKKRGMEVYEPFFTLEGIRR